MLKNILKNFSYKGTNSKKNFLSMLIITAGYSALLFVYFVYCYHHKTVYSGLFIIIRFLLTSILLFLLTTSIIKVFKKKEISIFAAVVLKIVHILFCLIAGTFLTGILGIGAHNINKKIEENIENRRKEKLEITRKLEEEKKTKKLQSEEEELNEKFLKVDYISGYMKVISESTPYYLLPPGMKNPFDLEELEGNISNGQENENITFEDLHISDLPENTVVKPLFKKTDPNGNEWILVYLNEQIRNQVDFVFIEAKNLKTDNLISDEKYFENEDYMLKDWKYYVVKNAENYSELWTK